LQKAPERRRLANSTRSVVRAEVESRAGGGRSTRGGLGLHAGACEFGLGTNQLAAQFNDRGRAKPFVLPRLLRELV
jgi:hypothetical protein